MKLKESEDHTTDKNKSDMIRKRNMLKTNLANAYFL